VGAWRKSVRMGFKASEQGDRIERMTDRGWQV
jgi:hypothetical protein